MDQELTQKLQYSYAGQNETYSLPLPLKDSFQLISDFFANNTTNKFCLVFPSKELAAQWLSIPIALELIKNDYINNFSEIYEAHKKYKIGDKLILNDDAIVEWAGYNSDTFYFKTRPEKNASGATIKVKISHIKKLKPSPPNRRVLSPFSRVKNAFVTNKTYPLDNVLNIGSEGNNGFIKSKICLVSKYKSFDKSHEHTIVNLAPIPDYFRLSKINDDGTVNIESPLLISNNLSALALYITLTSNSVSKIIIDGFAAIQERGTDFSDIDVMNIPTILITDLSEIESFETIGNYGFEFFNFTKENLHLDQPANLSPFHSFDKKLRKYISFNLVKEICHNPELETTIQKIHSIGKDEYNNDLNSLKISLIQLTNLVSRIAHVPTADEISVLNFKINGIETLFLQCKMWLGDSHKPIEESILLLKSIIKKFASDPSEKCVKLKMLINTKQYDYIICPTEEEAKALNASLSVHMHRPQIISVADVNDNLLSNKHIKAILTGWAKSSNINKILSSFLFSELTVLFYQFENKYYNSLQRRNRKYSENVRSTISWKGIRSTETSSERGFDELYSTNEDIETTSGNQFDILEFELKLDNIQYSRYKATGDIVDSIRARRIDFENDSFIYYASESHKLLVINDLIEGQKENTRYYRKKAEALKAGDIIALINTDRDILAELVEKNTTQEDLVEVKQWTDLWKNLLKEYFISIDRDFKKLVNDLRKYDCQKHEVTIRTWLLDENRIGPDDDSDLISIALLTNSDLLNDNTDMVRKAIRKMTGWRMKAADAIIKKIKSKIHEFADSSIINNTIVMEELGSLTVLRITEVSEKPENIDGRYINRLLQKDIL